MIKLKHLKLHTKALGYKEIQIFNHILLTENVPSRSLKLG